MSQLRNLQLFRNDVFVFTETINTVELLKGYVETTIASTLKDGEPIVIRYKEPDNGVVKALFGTGYVQGTTTTILWSGEEVDVNVETGSEDTDLVKITVSEDPKGNFQVSADVNTVAIANATDENNGLAMANDVNTYVKTAVSQITHPKYSISAVEGKTNEWQLNKDGEAVEGSVISVTIPEAETYTIAKLETAEDGFLATYELRDHSGNKVGTSINIPKDFLVKSGSIVTNPEGQAEGKYIEFVINAKEGTETDSKIYINVNDLVDAYTAGNGINITEANVVSVKYANGVEGHNVVFGTTANGELVANVDLSNVHNYSAGSNITISNDYVISGTPDTITTVKAGIGINVDTNEEDEHKYTVSIKKSNAEDNTIVIDEDGVYVAPYTAGNGIDITDNEIKVKVSDDEGNIISINENGELIATLADSVKISDLKVVNNNTQSAQYWTVGSDNKIVETSVLSEAKITVPAGKKYLLIATSDKNLYGDVLPETGDTFVASGKIVEVHETETTEAKTVIRLTRNDNVNVDVDMTDYVVVNAEAEYVNTAEKPDTMVVNTDGKFTQDVMDVIENYIDNYDCGSFTL